MREVISGGGVGGVWQPGPKITLTLTSLLHTARHLYDITKLSGMPYEVCVCTSYVPSYISVSVNPNDTGQKGHNERKEGSHNHPPPPGEQDEVHRDGIFKQLRRPGINSKESIPAAWRAGTTTLFLLGS